MGNKKIILWLILLLAVSFNTDFSVNAISRTYDWNVYGNTHYTVSVNAPNPQFDSPFDITVRLTLVSKDSSLDHTETKWMQVIIDSMDKPLHIESEKQNQTLTLNTPGDYWQRTFTMQVLSSQYGLGRGQGIEISIIYKISIDEIDIPRQLTWNHIGANTNDPMKTSLMIPFLNTTELIIVLVIASIASLIIARSFYLEMKERRREKEQRLRKEAEEKRKEKMLAENFECPYCHMLYDKKLEKCPNCGAPKKIRS
jgi:hypothetical protein